ncbi:hypothetical protein FQZ97_512220 [compost metagenome]
MRGAQRADGHQVVAHEHGRGLLLGAQDGVHRLVAALAGEAAAPQQRVGVRRRAGLRQRHAPAFDALLARGHAQRPADAGDALVAQRQQVPHREQAALHVGGFHQVAGRVGDLAVDQHGGNAQAAQLGGERVVLVGTGRHHDEPVDAALGQHLQVHALAPGLVVGVAQHQRVAGAEAAVFHDAHDLGEVGVRAVGNEHSQRRGGVALEAARHRVGHVAQLADRQLDALAHLGAHVARVVDDVRHGGDGNARLECDVLDGGHGCVGSLRLRPVDDRPGAGAGCR